jgi:hypothetical protein
MMMFLRTGYFVSGVKELFLIDVGRNLGFRAA